MRDYLFVDENKLNAYLSHIGGEDVWENKKARKISFSIKGPSYEIVSSRERRAATVDEKVELLIAFLERTHRLSHDRPLRMPQYNMSGEISRVPAFLLEQVTARKVILPSDHLKKVAGLRHLAIWIADHHPNTFSARQHDFDYCGTFLYLVEAHFDDERFGTVYSGCSALQMIHNAATGHPLLERRADEPLGRDSFKHPAEKLVALGAIVGDDRQVECLYRTRYMTDEQCYLFEGEERRVNDLLGYPIYIAELL